MSPLTLLSTDIDSGGEEVTKRLLCAFLTVEEKELL